MICTKCRGGETVDALRSGRSVLTDVWVRIPPSVPCALVAQWIERVPAEDEVVSSNLTKRATYLHLDMCQKRRSNAGITHINT